MHCRPNEESSHRIAFILGVVILFILFFFAVAFVFLFVIFFIRLFSKPEIGDSRAIEGVGSEAFWVLAVHVLMVRCQVRNWRQIDRAVSLNLGWSSKPSNVAGVNRLSLSLICF
jgi:hypothetical protein